MTTQYDSDGYVDDAKVWDLIAREMSFFGE